MADNLLVPLKEALARTIEQEKDVIQLLVEIRKVIEQSPTKDRYTQLKFFCDWPVHSNLKGTGAQKILNKYDAYLASKVLHNAPTALRMMQDGFNLISLQQFTDEMFAFLVEHRLDASLIANLDRLGPFLSSYIDIISRTPLIVGSASCRHLDRIEVCKRTTTNNQPRVPGERFMFGIDWLFKKDGVTQMNVFNEVWFPPPALRAPGR